MGCPALSPLVNCLRDDIEAELAAGIGQEAHLQAAARWRVSLPPGHVPADPCPESVRRWPILTAWRWLVPIPQRESSLFQDVNGSSATACSRETGSDLAYRGISQRPLPHVPLASGSDGKSRTGAARYSPAIVGSPV